MAGLYDNTIQGLQKRPLTWVGLFSIEPNWFTLEKVLLVADANLDKPLKYTGAESIVKTPRWPKGD